MVHRMHTVQHIYLALMLQVLRTNVCVVRSAMTQLVADWLCSTHECRLLQMGDDRSVAKAQTRF